MTKYEYKQRKKIKSSVKYFPAKDITVVTSFKTPIKVGCHCLYAIDEDTGEMTLHQPCHHHSPKSRDPLADLKDSSVRRTKNKIIDLALANTWEHMVTLTIDPKKIDSYNHDLTKDALQDWIHALRREHKAVAYILVPELHKDGKIHFHGLIRGLNTELLARARSAKTNRALVDRSHRPVFNLIEYDLGFSTVVPVDKGVDDSEKVSYYITKYITKDLIETAEFNRKRYWRSYNLNDAQQHTTEVDVTKDRSPDYTYQRFMGEFYNKFTIRPKQKRPEQGEPAF